MGSIVWTVELLAPVICFRNIIKMGGETEVETPVVDNKIEDTVKTDKEIIADEEKADKPEKETEEKESKEEGEKNESKKDEPVKPKKPTLHTKVWEEDKVYLYQSSRTPQIPSISAQELKLESWLKLQGITYENVDHKAKFTSKNGTLPFIEFNGKEIADTDVIIDTLGDKFEKKISDHLTEDQKNVEHAMMRMVENHLYWAIMHWRTSNVDNTIKAYKIHLPTFYGSKIPVGILNMHCKFTICRKTQKRVKSQGMANIEEMSKNDLTVLSNMLAEKEFMFGDDPSMLDMVVYSHLAQLIMVESEYPCPLRDFLQESRKNLVGLVNRMKDRCWGDHWELAIGDSMDLNPHIPKPEPEEEDKKDKADENTETKEESAPEDKDEASEKKEDESSEKKEDASEKKE